MQIAAVLFDRLTALDIIGPYEVLQRLPDAVVTFVGHRKGEVRTENGFLGLTVDATFDEVPRPDVIVVPGGVGTRALLDDEPLLSWLRQAHETTRYTTSVCTGSMVLGAAGLLEGLTATTYWAVLEELRRFGAEPDERAGGRAPRSTGSSPPPACRRASTWPSASPSSSSTTSRPEAMQLMIEYDPQPPFDSGAMHKADDVVITRVIEYAQSKK